MSGDGSEKVGITCVRRGGVEWYQVNKSISGVLYGRMGHNDMKTLYKMRRWLK